MTGPSGIDLNNFQASMRVRDDVSSLKTVRISSPSVRHLRVAAVGKQTNRRYMQHQTVIGKHIR